MACNGEDQECKDADDMGTSQNCQKSRGETWCRKEERESPNGYFRSCTTNYFLAFKSQEGDGIQDVDKIMDKNGFSIKTLCVDVVSKVLSFFTYEPSFSTSSIN